MMISEQEQDLEVLALKVEGMIRKAKSTDRLRAAVVGGIVGVVVTLGAANLLCYLDVVCIRFPF